MFVMSPNKWDRTNRTAAILRNQKNCLIGVLSGGYRIESFGAILGRYQQGYGAYAPLGYVSPAEYEELSEKERKQVA